MLYLVILFLVLALISGLLGFTGVEIVSIEIARVLFGVFLVLFVISLVVQLVRKKKA